VALSIGASRQPAIEAWHLLGQGHRGDVVGLACTVRTGTPIWLSRAVQLNRVVASNRAFMAWRAWRWRPRSGGRSATIICGPHQLPRLGRSRAGRDQDEPVHAAGPGKRQAVALQTAPGRVSYCAGEVADWSRHTAAAGAVAGPGRRPTARPAA
jgi:hypothetical protein